MTSRHYDNSEDRRTSLDWLRSHLGALKDEANTLMERIDSTDEPDALDLEELDNLKDEIRHVVAQIAEEERSVDKRYAKHVIPAWHSSTTCLDLTTAFRSCRLASQLTQDQMDGFKQPAVSRLESNRLTADANDRISMRTIRKWSSACGYDFVSLFMRQELPSHSASKLMLEAISIREYFRPPADCGATPRLNWAEALRAFLYRLELATGSDCATCYLRNPHTNELECFYHSRIRFPEATQGPCTFNSVQAQLIRANRVEFITEPSEHAILGKGDFATREGITSVMAIPLRNFCRDEDSAGIIFLNYRQTTPQGLSTHGELELVPLIIKYLCSAASARDLFQPTPRMESILSNRALVRSAITDSLSGDSDAPNSIMNLATVLCRSNSACRVLSLTTGDIDSENRDEADELLNALRLPAERCVRVGAAIRNSVVLDEHSKWDALLAPMFSSAGKTTGALAVGAPEDSFEHFSSRDSRALEQLACLIPNLEEMHGLLIQRNRGRKRAKLISRIAEKLLDALFSDASVGVERYLAELVAQLQGANLAGICRWDWTQDRWDRNHTYTHYDDVLEPILDKHAVFPESDGLSTEIVQDCPTDEIWNARKEIPKLLQNPGGQSEVLRSLYALQIRSNTSFWPSGVLWVGWRKGISTQSVAPSLRTCANFIHTIWELQLSVQQPESRLLSQ